MVKISHYKGARLIILREFIHSHAVWLLTRTKDEKKEAILGLIILLIKKDGNNK